MAFRGHLFLAVINAIVATAFIILAGIPLYLVRRWVGLGTGDADFYQLAVPLGLVAYFLYDSWGHDKLRGEAK